MNNGGIARIIPRLTPVTGLLLTALALGYLLFKTYQVSGSAGYDFRYIWLAGDLWLDGINPYGDAYRPAAAEAITSGHRPYMWVYPPTWWVFSVPFGAMSLLGANVAWNLANTGLIIGTCALLASAFVRAFPAQSDSIATHTGSRAATAVFTATFFLAAVLEATGILYSVGQTTLLCSFGIATMLWARLQRRMLIEAAGLTLVLLKPQIGVPFAILYLVLDPRSRRVLLTAGLISAALSLPALVTAPAVFLDFAKNIAGYDAFTDANLPPSMTGVRLILWEFTAIDTGNLAGTGIALAAMLLVCAGPLRLNRAADPVLHAWQTLALATAVIVACTPLHIYDFVLIMIPLPMLLCARWPGRVAGVIGMILIWRSENLAALTAFHVPEVEIFPGSRLATIGAFLFLAGIVDAVVGMNDNRPVRSP